MSKKKYDKEFKLNTVKLFLKEGLTHKQISDELGVPSSTLSGWVEEYRKSGEDAFPGKGCLKPADAEFAKLRKELAIAKEERDILKKALGIFSTMRK
mgnify:CR=1 FL=1|jgi:Transposase and inactivated derivatives